MARTIKSGLDYFPFDVDFFNDDKIELISSEFGIKGELIAIRLLCAIYRNGYYYKWGKDESLLFAKRVGNGLTGALVEEVITGLVKRSFFDEGVFDSFAVLTSRGIQKRYIDAKERSKNVELIREFTLLSDDEALKHNNVTFIVINVDKNSQRKEKKSKEKESKVNGHAPPDFEKRLILENPFSENFLQTWILWKDYKKKEFRFLFKSIESEQAAINELVSLADGQETEALKIIHQSMAHGWKGLFKLKENGQSNSKNGATKGTRANVKQVFDERYSQS